MSNSTKTNMKKITILFLYLMLTFTAAIAQKVRVACIGNSITYGHGIKDRAKDTYPAQLQALLGDDYDVRNFGVSGTTAQKEGDFPWVSTNEYKAALAFLPEIVVIKLGTNDSKPQNWTGNERFIRDLEALAQEFAALESHPRIIICLPAKAYEVRWDIHDDIIAGEELPALKSMAKRNHWRLVDLYRATSGKQERFPDGIHPDEQGAGIIAAKVLKAVKKERKALKR